MGLLGNLYTLAKVVRKKRSMNRTVRLLKANKGTEWFWQQLLELMANAQQWGLVKEQCLVAGQEERFAMAAENEQMMLECLYRIEREVGIDKSELERRRELERCIDIAIGRSREAEPQRRVERPVDKPARKDGHMSPQGVEEWDREHKRNIEARKSNIEARKRNIEARKRKIEAQSRQAEKVEDSPYIGSKVGRIFHRPGRSCTQNMQSENVVRFGSREAAAKRGYKPCLRCKP
jgi:hypothetical protein